MSLDDACGDTLSLIDAALDDSDRERCHASIDAALDSLRSQITEYPNTCYSDVESSIVRLIDEYRAGHPLAYIWLRRLLSAMAVSDLAPFGRVVDEMRRWVRVIVEDIQAQAALDHTSPS
jgi:hypothetical protein